MDDMKDRKPYIICGTEKGRAVLFGYCGEQPQSGETIVIHDARMILRWAEVGLLGIASVGPQEGADNRISARVSKTECLCSEWIEVSDQAEERLNEWPVYGVED